MINFIEENILKLCYCINYCIPKKKNQIFLYSNPDYSDNAKAIYEELMRCDVSNKYKIVWAVKDLERYKHLSTKKVKFVKHRTINNLINYCRSSIIFRTHSLWGNLYVKGRQRMCLVFHGMPIKKLTQPNGDAVKKTNCDFLPTTSSFFHKELIGSMDLDENKCIELGMPRNDYLFRNTNKLKTIYPGFSKYIIWMPTFRNAAGFVNGVEGELGISVLNRDNIGSINDLLKERNILLIMKLHPWVSEKFTYDRLSNIVNLKDKDIDIDYNLYELLGETDALITDYSSIYVDYLLLNKPIAYVFDDMEEYRKTRGFVFEPIEELMPGEKISDIKSLRKWIEEFDKNDKYKDKRKLISNLFHKHKDANSSRRVLEYIGLIYDHMK